MENQRVERRLSAILSADVVGYGRLMGADEEATLAALKAHRAALIDPNIAAHRGRIVNTAGDGILAEFASVVDAVRSAVEMQQAMAKRNSEVPEDRRIIWRIGINLGDVIVDGDDIHGDGVNVAARLQGIADPGGVCVSGAARDQVVDKIPFAFEDMGERQVKNIARPVRAYRVQLRAQPVGGGGIARVVPRPGRRAAGIAAGLVLMVIAGAAIWTFRTRGPEPAIEPASVDRMAFPLPDKPSIAVLPFDNLSQDSDQEYFSDGITEDIITALSKFRGLFVIARNSSFVYKGKPVKVQRVAEELGVRYVLEGSVRRAGERIRINTQLIDATTGHHLWAERYDRALKDVFALQDEVTQKIVAAISVEVSSAEAKRAMREDTTNLRAYDYVLRGRILRSGLTSERNAKAREMFEKAIEIDPNYARAYSYLAWTHLNDWQLGSSEADVRSLERAFEFAQKAKSLDPWDSNAHMALGEVYLWKKQFGPAIAESKRAVALNPNDADAYANLADRLTWAGEPEQAIGYLEQAMRLNPNDHHFTYSWFLGHAYFVLQRYDEAIAQFEMVVDGNPSFWPAHIYLAASHSQLGRIQEAQSAASEALRLNPALSSKQARGQIPYKNPEDLERFLGSLAGFGIPQ